MKKIEKTKRGFVLADGEVTGHAHRVQEDVDLYQKENESEKYLKSTKDFEITHEEHDAFVVPADNYNISIVKEYDHYQEIVRKVLD
jgi:hypothetical protein